MIYTQQELEAMSDFELNKITSGYMGLIIDEDQYTSYGDRDENIVLYDNGHGAVDYCNNWSDCGALIDECGISIERDLEVKCDRPISWWNAWTSGVCCLYQSNPKRAVAMVYILINQSKSVK